MDLVECRWLMTDEITWWDHVMRSHGHDITIASFLGASSVECIICQRYLVFVLWHRWKNLLPINRKVKKKNRILEYLASSSKGYDKEDTRSIDEKPPKPGRVLIEKNRKIHEVWLVKKLPNLQVGYLLRGNRERIKQEKGLRLLCLLAGGGGGPSRLATFLHWACRGTSRLALRGPSLWWSCVNGEGGCCQLL